MKKLYLASSVDRTGIFIGKDIAKYLNKPVQKLKLAFIDTAGELEVKPANWQNEDRDGLVKVGFDIFDYSVTGKNRAQIEKDLERADVIHVNGGNTFYLLLQSRRSGFDKWIYENVSEGKKVYLGSSAGSIITAPVITGSKFFENNTYDKELETHEGFGLVEFNVFPHWGSPDFRNVYLKKRMGIAYEPINKIIVLNDWQFVKVEDDKFKIIDVRD